MRRYILLLFVTLTASIAHSQSINTLIERFREAPEADYIHIPRLVMSFIKILARNDKEDRQLLKTLSSIRVLSIDDCSPMIKTQFRNAIQSFQPTAYTPFILHRSDDEINYIYLKEKKNCICELLILSSTSSSGEIVRIKGKVSTKDLNQLIHQHGRLDESIKSAGYLDMLRK